MRSLPFVESDTLPAVIVPLVAEDLAELGRLAAACAATTGIDALEWRVDEMAALYSPAPSAAPDAGGAPAGGDAGNARAGLIAAGLAAIAEHTALPVLVTVRTTAEGGAADLNEDAYREVLTEAIAAGPAAVDIEFARRDAGDLIAAAAEAGVASVASAHDFTDTPPSKQLLRTMKGMADLGADVAKVAVMPHDRTDVLEALKAADRGRSRLRIPVIVVAMGRRGRLTRLIGGEFGSAATFATVGEGSAPGQVDVAEVVQTLRILAAED